MNKALAQDPASSAKTEEEEVLHASMKAGSVAQIVVAAIATVGLIYLLKVVLVTVFTAMLLAFALEPLVHQLQRIRIPRPVGALLAVLLLIAVAAGATHFFYSRAVDFATELPKYSSKIRGTISGLRAQTSKIEESTKSVIASPKLENGRCRSKYRSRPASRIFFRLAAEL